MKMTEEVKSAKECRLCENQTEMRVNIKFSAVPVCNSCLNSITKQQVIWLSENQKPLNQIKKEQENE